MKIKSLVLAVVSLAALATGCDLQAHIVGPNAPTEACYDLYSETPCARPDVSSIPQD